MPVRRKRAIAGALAVSLSLLTLAPASASAFANSSSIPSSIQTENAEDFLIGVDANNLPANGTIERVELEFDNATLKQDENGDVEILNIDGVVENTMLSGSKQLPQGGNVNLKFEVTSPTSVIAIVTPNGPMPRSCIGNVLGTVAATGLLFQPQHRQHGGEQRCHSRHGRGNT